MKSLLHKIHNKTTANFFLLRHKFSSKHILIIVLSLLFCKEFSYSQNFFPIKFGDLNKNYFYHKYIWGIYYGGSGGDSSKTYNQIISDTLSYQNNIFNSYWENNYYFLNTTDNKLYVLLNNQVRLAVDFNKTSGGDTLFYDGTSKYYHYKGINNLQIMGKPRRMFWIDFYYEGNGPGGQYRLLKQNWGFKFLDSIGQFEYYYYVYADATGFSYSETKDRCKTYYVKNSCGTFILFESPSIVSAAVVSDSIIKLNWADILEYENGYIVERRKLNENNFNIIANLPPNSVQYFDYDVLSLQTYQYRIRTKVDTLISSPKDTITISTLRPPENLSASNTTKGKILLSWNFSSTVTPNFIVERKMLINTNKWSEYIKLDSTNHFQTNHIDSNVTESQKFKYRVKAILNDISSMYSNEVEITPIFSNLHAPFNFTANINEYEAVQLNWQDTNYIAMHYDLQRKIVPNSFYNTLTAFWNRDTSYIDETIPSSTLIYYRISSVYGNNSSSFAELQIMSPPFMPLISPSNLNGTIYDSNKVILTWNDNSNNEKEFYIVRGKTQSSAFNIGRVNRNFTTFIDSFPKLHGLDAEQWYGVYANNPHSWSNTNWFYLEITDIQGHNIPETNFTLSSNFPNPFNPTTTIYFQIPKLQHVQLVIYDVLGKEVATLVNEEKSAGNYEVEFRTGDLHLSSGIYFYRLQAGESIETKKMILLR